MTDHQLTERIAKLQQVNAAEIGCRAGELLAVLTELQETRANLDRIRSAAAEIEQVNGELRIEAERARGKTTSARNQRDEAQSELARQVRAADTIARKYGLTLTAPQDDPIDPPGCRFARNPGRGDCEHFLGLPGKSIPGQHDGPDDTVDIYGKPNGWCWSCWKDKQIEHWQSLAHPFRRWLRQPANSTSAPPPRPSQNPQGTTPENRYRHLSGHPGDPLFP